MDLRSLRHVVGLANRLSYTKAANDLGLSQSALSRSIQAIEQQAKVRLFDRDRGGVHPTAVGRIFVERAAELLRDADDLNSLLDRAASGDVGEVVFGMAPLPAAALLPAIFSRDLTEHQELRRRVAVRPSHALLPLLLSEKIEFFICAEGEVPATAPVNSAALGWFPTSLIVRAGHPLLAPDAGVARNRYPLIVAACIDDYAQLPYVSGPPDVVLEDYGALLRLTESSDAIWLSSVFAVVDEIQAGRLVELPARAAEGVGRFRMMIYSLDRRSLSPAALRFRDCFRLHIRQLSEMLIRPPETRLSARG